MQIACRCKYCGHIFTNDKEDDLCLEIDFLEEEMRFVCRERGCKKTNRIKLASLKKVMPLPGILTGS
jgi:rubredoxin